MAGKTDHIMKVMKGSGFNPRSPRVSVRTPTGKGAPANQVSTTALAEDLVDSPVGDIAAGKVSQGRSPVLSAEENEALLQRMGMGRAPAIPEAPPIANVAQEAEVAAASAASNVVKTGEVVGRAAAPFEVLAPLENVANTVTNTATMGGFVAPMAVGGVIAVAGKMKKTATVSKLQKLKDYWHPDGRAEGELSRLDHANNIGFAVSGGLSVYAVGKSFSEQLNALKHAIADINGETFGKVSTTQALFGTVPESLKPARDHLVKEHLIRGTAQVVGFISMVWAAKNKKHLSPALLMAPMFVDMGANAILGESVLPAYAALKNAYGAGQPLPPEMYAEFLLSASNELKKRGAVGKIVAQKLGEQYTAERADPGSILREIDGAKTQGKFKQRIDSVIAAAESEHAEMVAESKAKQSAKAQHEDKKHGSVSMVDKVMGKKPVRHAVGPHTEMLSNQAPTGLGVS